MITNPPLYTATGGPKSHSIRRKKIPPMVRQKTLPLPESPVKRKVPAVTRQRSLSPSRLKTEEELQLTVSRRMKQRQLSQSYCDIVTTNRRLVLALDQFTSTALPFYLELITRYTNKIQKVGVKNTSYAARATFVSLHQMQKPQSVLGLPSLLYTKTAISAVTGNISNIFISNCWFQK